MSDHLITEIIKIEAEADRIIDNAKQKADEIISGIDNEIGFIKITLENEYRQKLEAFEHKITELQKSDEKQIRNEFELLEKKLLGINSKSMEEAVGCVLKHIYGI